MRLFIAVNFNDKVKNQIKEIINKVGANSRQGKFVNKEHMHLTVEFLGEIPAAEVNLIQEIIHELGYKPFTLRLNEIGCFQRRDGNIYWLGIERHDTLFEIHDELHQKLINQGFKLEDRKYKPHLTIGRKIKLDNGFDPKTLNGLIEAIAIYVDKIDLMKSEHIDGKLMHTVVYSKRLCE